ncbi:MAG TPA: hypothetical protein DD706_02435, partial [Nitrospiraceae bacterium]|nr:hypothetical protein [Nitrospiraceae bacterium]
GKPHPTAKEQIKAFAILKQGQQERPDFIKSLQDQVLQELAKIAVPREIEIVPSLQKTRSGKIARLSPQALACNMAVPDTAGAKSHRTSLRQVSGAKPEGSQV